MFYYIIVIYNTKFHLRTDVMNLSKLKNLLLKMPQLFLGFILCGLGIAMMKNAGLGLNPWGIFHMGISNQTGISFGTITQTTGLAIILLSLPLKIIPGVGTILNMYFIGMFIDIFDRSTFIMTPEPFILKLLILVAGMCIMSGGIFFYLSCGLGAGPRDGLMLGLMKILNKPVSVIKTVIEVSAMIIGLILGGPLGIGTVIIALSFGYCLEMTFKIGRKNAKEIEQRNLKDEYNRLFNKTQKNAE